VSDWLDIGDEAQLPATIDHIVEETSAFPAAWSKLSDAQKRFLEAWRNCGFSNADAFRLLGQNPRSSQVTKWLPNEHFVFCRKILKKLGMQDALDKAHQVTALERLANKLETPKPILYQGVPVYHEGVILHEEEAGAAAKVRETLLKVGGHLKEDVSQGGFTLPALIVQVTNKTGEIEQTVNVGIAPPTPALDWVGDGT
jgi:hypothetical protein